MRYILFFQYERKDTVELVLVFGGLRIRLVIGVVRGLLHKNKHQTGGPLGHNCWRVLRLRVETYYSLRMGWGVAGRSIRFLRVLFELLSFRRILRTYRP